MAVNPPATVVSESVVRWSAVLFVAIGALTAATFDASANRARADAAVHELQATDSTPVRGDLAPPPVSRRKASAVALAALVGVVIAFLGTIGTIGAVRVARRLRQAHVRGAAAAPTPATDVWSQHRVPDPTDDEGGEPDDDPDGDDATRAPA